MKKSRHFVHSAMKLSIAKGMENKEMVSAYKVSRLKLTAKFFLFADINFRKSNFFCVHKLSLIDDDKIFRSISFRRFCPNPRNARKFLPKRVCTLTVCLLMNYNIISFIFKF